MKLQEFGADDLEALVALPASVGWLDRVADWRTLLACARVFGHRDEAGVIVSCGALVDHGEVGFVAKMVVRPELQGRGLGRAVLERVMAAARPGARLALVATTMGAPVYARAGFVEIGRISKLLAPDAAGLRDAAVPADAGLVETMTEPTVGTALGLDRVVFGADRRPMLRARMAQPGAARVLRVAGAVVGYGLAVAQGDLTVLGPVLAPDAAGAIALVTALARTAAGPLRIDVPDAANPEGASNQRALTDWLGARGFTRVDHQAAMSLGAVELPGARERLFALAAQAFG